jgi:hypothetical protein
VLHLAKSHSARQVARGMELEAARSKLAEVEHHERTLTSENEGLKKSFGGCTLCPRGYGEGQRAVVGN